MFRSRGDTKTPLLALASIVLQQTVNSLGFWEKDGKSLFPEATRRARRQSDGRAPGGGLLEAFRPANALGAVHARLHHACRQG